MEFTIEQIKAFVKKGYTSVSARYVKAALQHYDEVVERTGGSDLDITNCPECGSSDIMMPGNPFPNKCLECDHKFA